MTNLDPRFILFESVLNVSDGNKIRITRLMHRIFESKEKDLIEESINIDEGC